MIRTSLILGLLIALQAVFVAASPSRTADTNADRLRRGLPPNKPSRLYDNRRRSALRPRNSLGPNVMIASSPLQTDTPGARKRSLPANMFFCVNTADGSVTYTGDGSIASTFYYPDTSETSLYWLATVDIQSAGIVMGTSYPLMATPIGSALSGNGYHLVIGGSSVTGAVAMPLGTPRYNGDVNLKINGLDYVWFLDGSKSQLGITNDILSTTYTLLDQEVGAFSVQLVAQTFTSLVSQTTTDAMDWYHLGTSLTNPIAIWGMNSDTGGYWNLYDGQEQEVLMGFNVRPLYCAPPPQSHGPLLTIRKFFTFYVPLLLRGLNTIPIIAPLSDGLYAINIMPVAPGFYQLFKAPYDPSDYSSTWTLDTFDSSPDQPALKFSNTLYTYATDGSIYPDLYLSSNPLSGNARPTERMSRQCASSLFK